MVTILYGFTALAALTGAIASNSIARGGSIWPYLLTSAWMGPLSWALLARFGTANILVLSVVWNVVYEGVWTITTIIILGSSVTATQVIGAILVLIGLTLVTI